jgi:hypothetical protein
MTRYLAYACAVFAVALLAAPAASQAQEQQVVPLNGESTDNMANDLNAQQLKKIQSEQARMEREVEEKNAEAMRKYHEQQERNVERWRKEQMMLEQGEVP